MILLIVYIGQRVGRHVNGALKLRNVMGKSFDFSWFVFK